MGKYSELVKDFDYHAKYKDPVVDPLIVGLTGIAPDEKVNESEIDHEALSGLLGGGVTGHYHLTDEQLAQVKTFKGRIDNLVSELQELSAGLNAKIRELEDNQAFYHRSWTRTASRWSCITKLTKEHHLIFLRQATNGDMAVRFSAIQRLWHRVLDVIQMDTFTQLF